MPNYPAGRTFDGYRNRVAMRERLDDVPVTRTWLVPGAGRSPFLRLANYLSFTATGMVAAAAARRPDVLFVESQPLTLGWVGVALKRLRGVPYIYNVPDLQVDVARELGFISDDRLLSVAAAMEDLFLRESWKVATVTEGFIDHFVGRGIPREQVTFLPNGADADFLRPLPADPALVERWGLSGKVVFAYVGTHAIYHGLDTLVRAAAILRQRDPRIHVLFIGDGPEREPLQRLAADLGLTNVTFGSSPYEEMARLYSLAYASVATLRDMPVAEGMRLSKVFPALACGVPVVYAGRGEAAAMLHREECGVVVPPEDPAALASAMEGLAADPAARRALGERGRQLIEREYSWAAIVDRWLGELGSAYGPEPARRAVSEA
jgi:glycosyltransferase involved in cell wall biosynthesis